MNNLSSASCDELSIPMRSSHNSIMYSGHKGIFYRPHRVILEGWRCCAWRRGRYTGTPYITTVSSILECLQYFQVLQSVPVDYSKYCCCIPLMIRPTCYINAFVPQFYQQRRMYEDTHDRLSKTSTFYFVPSVSILSLAMYIINGC